ncbi:MAG: hypothetical protein IT332_14140 [Ardenticatenales bacterium]|nr:hypothetical protein [Ardenticatenales bacterium]
MAAASVIHTYAVADGSAAARQHCDDAEWPARKRRLSVGDHERVLVDALVARCPAISVAGYLATTALMGQTLHKVTHG